ncbi:MAG: GtrA family protein [Lachnospiraceae bacterium]|nr:GtrA family protein [Lachnospiraceae bacterium]
MKIIKLIQHLWKKHEEAMNYLFWGGVAFLLSIILFHIFANMMNLYEQIANTLSWIICVIFTYLTNRFFVFKSKTRGLKRVTKEFTDFVTARIITLVMENAILFVMIDLLTIHNMIAKLVGQFVVIVSNYILSKLWIFKKEKKDESERKTG